MKSLYAYFGLLNLHTIDSPGHSLYQIGLMDSLRQTFGIDQFDFFSYYPEDLQKTHSESGSRMYPTSPIGNIFERYKDEMVHDHLMLDETLANITAKKYNMLFLKARFRNLSTLQKKWKDAKAFELLIETAIHVGYTKDQIIILDTDLSLPDSFSRRYGASVTIRIPSIDFPGISNRFLLDCVSVHTSDYIRDRNTVFYGNIDTSSYKSGNSKNAILGEALSWITSSENKLIIISKQKDLDEWNATADGILRNNRGTIWDALDSGLVMLNITKDKYDTVRFIPARVYEAMIFGMIPVSYNFNFLCETFSFSNIDDLVEIIKYLNDCEPEDQKKAYIHFIDNYCKYIKSLNQWK
jgi:hypothetical protein